MKNDIVLRDFKNNFFSASSIVDGFFFSMLCATIFTFTIFHWILDLNYKYEVVNTETNFNILFYFSLIVVVAFYYIYKVRRVEFDIKFLLLCQIMILVAAIDYHFESYIFICYAYILPMSYLVGGVALHGGGDVEKRIVQLFFVLAVAMYIRSFLDFRMNWRYNWEWGTEAWPSHLVWLGEISRTTFEYGFILISSSICYALHVLKRNKYYFVLIIFAETWVIWFGIKTEGRENACILALSIMLFVFMTIYDKWDIINKKKVLIVLISFLLILALIIKSPYVENAISNSYWAGGGGIFENERINIDINAIKKMLEFPVELNTTSANEVHSHSMALEYGRVYDIVIFILIMLFKIMILLDAVRLLKKKNNSIKYLLFPAFCALNLYYIMEPNAYAHRYFWIPGLFISGMIHGFNEKVYYRK